MDGATYVLEDLGYELDEDDAAARRARLVPVVLLVVAALIVGVAGAWLLLDARADSADQAEELRLVRENLRATSDDLAATRADVQRLTGRLDRNLATIGGGAGSVASSELRLELDELGAALDELHETVAGWRADRRFLDGEIAQIDSCLENLRLHASELGDGFELTC